MGTVLLVLAAVWILGEVALQVSEEAFLRRAFGAAWDEHAAATGRLLPRVALPRA